MLASAVVIPYDETKDAKLVTAVACDGVQEAVLDEADAKVVMAELVEESFDVKVALEDLEIRADPEGVKRRALLLRDDLLMGKKLVLRPVVEDMDAVALKDADRGMTLLHWAAFYGRADAVREILDFRRGLDSFLDDDGRTPLDHASTPDCQAILRSLRDDDSKTDDETKSDRSSFQRTSSFFDDDHDDDKK